MKDDTITQASAYSPAGISSFFRVHGPLKEPKGATGGGFTLTNGVTTQVKIQRSNKMCIKIYINNVLSMNAETSRNVVNILLLRASETPFMVSIRHHVEPPIGAGFGTSAAGALSLALALSEALKLNLTLEEVATIAHESEIVSRTGLATVAALTVGGCVVTYEPGPPGICKIMKIPVDPNLRLVTAYFTTKNTREILQIPDFDRQINKWGDITLQKILQDPSVETLLTASREFALQIGLMTKKVETTIKLMEHAGAIAATQNMLGEAVHAAAYKEDLNLIVENLKKNIKPRRVLVSKIGGTPTILTPILGTATLQH